MCVSLWMRGRPTRGLTAGLVLIAGVLMLGSCRRGAPGQAGRIFKAPVHQLTRDDLGRACVALGWEDEGVTSASQGAHASVLAACSRAAEGDGGRQHMVVALYRDEGEALKRIESRVKGERGAWRMSGQHVLAVTVHEGTAEQAQQILERLAGPP